MVTIEGRVKRASEDLDQRRVQNITSLDDRHLGSIEILWSLILEKSLFRCKRKSLGLRQLE